MPTYSDLNLDFFAHPNTKDVVRRYDIDAVKTAVRNLIMTNAGEKLFDPRFGASINKLLFEPLTPDITFMLKKQWNEMLNYYESRAIIEELEVASENAELVIILKISMRENPSITFTLPVSVTQLRY